MKSRLVTRCALVSGLVLALISAYFVLMPVSPAQAVETVTVDFSVDKGPVTYQASGFLMSMFGTNDPVYPDKPANNLITPLKPQIVRWGWPGPNTNTPPGFEEYAKTRSIGAKYMVVPGDYIVWNPLNPAFQGKTIQQVCQMMAQTAHDNNYTGIIWDFENEPNLEGQTYEQWRDCYRIVHNLIPNAETSGPSFSSFYQSDLENWILRAQADNVVPTYLTWHFSGERDVQTMRTFLAAHGLSNVKVMINEVTANWDGATDMHALVNEFAQSERTQYPIVHAGWSNVNVADAGQPDHIVDTTLYPVLDGMLSLSQKRRGVWWVNKVYGDMTGRIVSVDPTSNQDGVASQDANNKIARVLIGGGNLGYNAGLTALSNLNSVSYLVRNGTVHVKIELIDGRLSSSRQEVTGLTPISEGDYQVTNNQVLIDYTNVCCDSSSALLLTVTPGQGSGSGTTPTVTPTATPTSPPAGGTTTIDDQVRGSGQSQFNYSAGWDSCSGVSACGRSDYYNNTESWTNGTNNTVTVAFNGKQVKLYCEVGNVHGIGAVSIDGGTETMVDFYRSSVAGNTLVWTSPVLSTGNHTFKLRATGNKNASSGNTYITTDRIDIIS